MNNPTISKSNLERFAAQHPEVNFASYFNQLTPALLDTARPFGSDELGWDISVYPSHEKNGKCNPKTCEAITLVNTISGDGPSFPTEEAAEAFITEMKQALRGTVLFLGIERDASAILPDGTLAASGFTEDETLRARELARPFNEYDDDDPENSMSLSAGWMDANGKFIFQLIDNLTDSTTEIVHENFLTTLAVYRTIEANEQSDRLSMLFSLMGAGLTEAEAERAFVLIKAFNDACERLNNTIHANLQGKDDDGLIFVINWGIYGDRSFVTEKEFIAASAEFVR